MILGDNIFYGNGLGAKLAAAKEAPESRAGGQSDNIDRDPDSTISRDMGAFIAQVGRFYNGCSSELYDI